MSESPDSGGPDFDITGDVDTRSSASRYPSNRRIAPGSASAYAEDYYCYYHYSALGTYPYVAMLTLATTLPSSIPAYDQSGFRPLAYVEASAAFTVVR